MSVRKKAGFQGLTVWQRLTIFHGTGVTAEQALSLDDDAICFDFLVCNGCKALNLATAGVKPVALKGMGVENPVMLRRLGFDALHLVDTDFCNEANAAYGAASVVEAFLQSPADAVALAGSEAVTTLNISVQKLLETCAGAPIEALSVIQQTTSPSPLKGVMLTTLLDSGVRASQLKPLGYGLSTISEMTGNTPANMQKLGFAL
jgi:hypothetical protein